MDIKKWVKEEIEKGEDIEVIKGAVEILGFDKKIVKEVLEEMKKEKPVKKEATPKKDVEEKDEPKEQIDLDKKEETVHDAENKISIEKPIEPPIIVTEPKEENVQTQETLEELKEAIIQQPENQATDQDKKETQHYLKEEPVEVLEFHVPRELIEQHHEQSKQIKKYIVYLLIFTGISLIMLGAYLFYYIQR